VSVSACQESGYEDVCQQSNDVSRRPFGLLYDSTDLPRQTTYHAYSLLNCLFITLPPTGERSIVMSVSVCVCVCLSAIISSELHVRSSSNVLCMLPVACVGGVAQW